MPTRLIQVVAFVNVPAAGVAILPHNININDIAKRPDFVAADAAGFTVAVTATQVSVTNTNAAPTSVNVWLELKHSIPRELGALPNLTPQPFVAAAGAAGGSPTIIVEDEGVVIPGNPFTNLNFAGAGVTVADAGGGIADITVPGGTGLQLTEVTNNDVVPFAPGAPIAVTGLRATARCSNFPNDTPLEFAKVLGLCTAATPIGNTAQLIDAGPLTLTTAEWDAITDQVGGLTPNALYYLADSGGPFQPGRLTTTPNGSQRIVYVGEAISATTLHVNIDGATPDIFNEPQSDTEEGLVNMRVRLNVDPYNDPTDSGEVELTRIGQGAATDVSFSVLAMRDAALTTEIIGTAAPVMRFNRFFAAQNFQGIFADGPVNNQVLLQSYILAEAAAGGGTFTGFVRNAEFLLAGRPIVFAYNIGPGSITLAHQDAGSLAANRIICPGGVSLVIRSGGGWIMTYDSVITSRWFIMGVNA